MFYLFQYYAESHGIIYVIDSTDEERLGESKNAFGEGSIQFCTITILMSYQSKVFLHMKCRLV